MLKEDSKALTGNDRFEGYAIELIENLAEDLGFNYTFLIQEDRAYGSLDPKTGQWNGMMKEILEGVSFNMVAYIPGKNGLYRIIFNLI